MNKTMIRRITVIAAAAAITAVPVFAQSWGRYDNNRMPGRMYSNEAPCMDGWGQGPQGQAPHMMQQGPRHMGMGMGMPGGRNDKMTIGTVSSVNQKSGTITVTNADGKDVTVHVSPVTRILIDDGSVPDRRTPAFRDQRNTDTPEKQNTIENIQSGSFIMVGAFDTDTKTIEAARIFVKKAD